MPTSKSLKLNERFFSAHSRPDKQSELMQLIHKNENTINRHRTIFILQRLSLIWIYNIAILMKTKYTKIMDSKQQCSVTVSPLWPLLVLSVVSAEAFQTWNMWKNTLALCNYLSGNSRRVL